jgi:hypothetical protein
VWRGGRRCGGCEGVRKYGGGGRVGWGGWGGGPFVESRSGLISGDKSGQPSGLPLEETGPSLHFIVPFPFSFLLFFSFHPPPPRSQQRLFVKFKLISSCCACFRINVQF